MFFLSVHSSYAIAKEEIGLAPQSSNQLIDYLSQEKDSLLHLTTQFKAFVPPKSQQEYELLKKQNDSMLAANKVRIVNLKSFLAEQKDKKDTLSRHVKLLQQAPVSKGKELQTFEKIARKNLSIEVTVKTIHLIEGNIAAANEYNLVLLNNLKQLEIWLAQSQLLKKNIIINQKIKELKQKKEGLLARNIELQGLSKSVENFDASFNYEAEILLNSQKIVLVQSQIADLEIRKRQANAEINLLKHPQEDKAMQALISVYQQSIEQQTKNLTTLHHSLKRAASMQARLSKRGLITKYNRYKEALHKHILSIEDSGDRLRAEVQNLKVQINKQLSLRQSFTEYNISSWPLITKEVLLIPGKLFQYANSLLFKVRENYSWQDSLLQTLYWLALAAFLGAAFLFNQIIDKYTQEKVRSLLAGHLYDWVVVIVKRNLLQLTVISILLITFFINRVPFVSYQLLFNLIVVWMAFRNLILIARLLLLERVSDASGKDVKLYYRLKWLFLAGGWSTALMVVSHQLPLSLLSQDLFSRLFMLFLLALAIVLWKSRDIVPHLLWPILKTKKKYVRNVVSLLVTLVPLTILTTAIIGLVGYINLAWKMSRYQVYVLLIITSYMLVRGLVADLLEIVSEWMISSLRNGWLWIEVVLKPLDKILRILLVILVFIVLFQLLGGASDPWVMGYLLTIIQYPVLDVSGVHITLLSIIQFTILLMVFIWAAKWTREFCYRWLYSKARDPGIRNSLSVFTQYAVILIGAFITLRVLGLDFSGMSMILGGLAVGMGFGLRDFASNIIGGIMLLIERPVREGDLITLGDYEGRVAHIGIRSMRVSSWDNMEVLIPNAETFNKPFTNWTHQDNVVRTVVPIKVNRSDDPLMVQQLILDVLAIIPEILESPQPQVFLKQIDEALIEFEVRYFINVQQHTRFEVRSKVLFAITAQFNASGVKPPVPPLSIELKGKD